MSRAHANQYDVPCIATISRNLPSLNDAGQPFTLSAFVSLCKMFTHFDRASSAGHHTARSLLQAHDQLQEVPALDASYNALQRADISVTRHWMRLMLWKTAMSHIKMVTDQSGSLESISFPLHIARDLVASVSDFSIDVLEAHGPGMELKLFASALSVADLMACLPLGPNELFQLRPHECLGHIATLLGNFRGGNRALLPVLQSRLADAGLAVPAIPRLLELNNDSSDGEFASPPWGENSGSIGSLMDGTQTQPCVHAETEHHRHHSILDAADYTIEQIL